MKSAIHFMLHEVLPEGQVTGRNCGSDVPTGIFFTSLCRCLYPPRAAHEPHVAPTPELVCEIDLRLDVIEIYRRKIDLLVRGYTAMLTLNGAGLDYIAKLLAEAPDHLYYSLHAPAPV